MSGHSKVLQDGLSREIFKLGEEIETRYGHPRPELTALPFHAYLPKDHIELLRFRVYVRRRCLKDSQFRAAIIQMCKLDVVFFSNVFCFTFEPRPPRPIPIKCWNDQADLLAIMQKWFGRRSLGIAKSRGIGGSWSICILYAWALLFIDEVKLGMISKDIDGVDSDDTNSLLGKLWYLIEKLPEWMKRYPDGRAKFKRTRTAHRIDYIPKEGVVQGFPSGDNKIRGMRFSSLFHDESAFWPGDAQAAANTAIHTSPNRIYVSTMYGSNNSFYDMMYRDETSVLRVFVWWWNNEARRAGMYTTENGRLKIIDTDYQFPPDYPFVLDGLLRSPYVDNVLRETPQSKLLQTLEELYGVQEDQGRKWFRKDTLSVIDTTIRPPARRGMVYRVERDGRDEVIFTDDKDGKILIWGRYTGTPDGGPYSAGSDLAYGKGTSTAAYSTLEVFDLLSGEQVLEFADNSIDAVSFAQLVRDIMEWLCQGKGHGHCYHTFENNGEVGQSYGAEMKRIGWGNIQTRRRKYTERDREPEYLGMRNNDKGVAVYGEMERAIRSGELIIRSEHIREEMAQFEKEEKTDGKVRPLYPYRADGNGDRTMGMAISWKHGRGYRASGKVRQFSDSRFSHVDADREAIMQATYNALSGSGSRHQKRPWRDRW